MADAGGGVSFDHLEILNLTPEEKRVFKQLFSQADTDNSGVITGEVAVKFLEKTKVPGGVLGEIWQIADQENRGFLTPAGFAVCLRLIGKYQGGQDPDGKLAFQPGPLPKFEGVSLTNSAPPPAGPPPGLQPQLSGSGPIRVPPLSPEKAADYAGLFERSGAQNGIMSGETAKQIFEKAKLPNEVLGRIWNLADTEQRGALSQTEFIIAMHLLASFKGRTMTGVPATLPAGLYEAATRRGPPPRAPGGPPAAISRQFSGGSARPQSPLARPPYVASSPTTSASGRDWDWDITFQEKQQYDVLFDKVDTGRNGFITGEQAVVFFSESGLSEDHLAQIWDLSDILSEGKLNRDEFAVAMYLIRLQRGKPTSVLPASLHPRLIPPAMRSQKPSSQPTAPAFDNAAHSTGISKSASEDLFGLDALTSSPTVTQAPQAPQATGGSATAGLGRASNDPFGSQPSSPKSPTGSQFLPAASTGSFKPFKPTSAFGQGLQTQHTGASAGSSASVPRGAPLAQTSNLDDLLGDNDPEVSKKLTQETTELANMSNQIGTLRTQMEEVQSKKTVNETELNKAGTQKRDLELRLSQFRTQYENEIRAFKALEERLNSSRADTEKLKREYAMVDGSRQDLHNQHRQVAEALGADQRENANLRQKIGEMTAEISQLKPQLEKMRSDARQQKGMVAINKKQLSTSEGERDKIKNEMGTLTKEAEERARQSPATAPAAVASPALSTASQSTNPFFRRTSTQPVGSPSPVTRTLSQSQENFDNFFGPSAFTPSQGGAPPQTTFRAESNAPNFTNQASSSVISSDAGVPTPSTSPPLSSYQESPQPPPPPESRQMTSKELPLRDTVLRTESLSSSVRVGTPGSRLGPLGTDTPTPLSPSPASPVAASRVSRGLERENSNRTETASPFDRASTASPSSSSVVLPGAFPEPSPAQPSAGTVDGKSDFDAAFANYGSAKTQEKEPSGSSLNGSVSSGGPSKFHQEFPPIQDLEPDEDSDTSDDQGFEDNFGSPDRQRETPAPLAAIQTVEPATNEPPADEALTPRPTLHHLGSSTLSDPPTPNAQKSPPTYGETMSHETSHGSGSTAFPPEFSGLLPSREDPTVSTSPPPSQSREPSPEDRFGGPVGGGGGQGHALFGGGPSSPITAIGALPVQNDTSSAANDAYSSVISQPETEAPSASQPSHASKPSFIDEFDTGFDDLAEAKEDEQEDDDFMHSSQIQDGFDEFNPTFDSPAASKTNTMASLGATPTGKGAAASQPIDSSFGDFELDIESAFGGSSSGVAKPSGQDFGNDSANWDEIFNNMDKQATDSKPDLSSTGFSFPEPPSSSNSRNDTSPVPAATTESDSKMPQLARALSSGTEHDDPILKQLTGKGYPRAEALDMLEKYDYDYNKALDELSQPDVIQLTNMGFSKTDAVKALQAYDYDLNKAANYLTAK